MSRAFKSFLTLAALVGASVAVPALADQNYLLVDETERLPPEALPDPTGLNSDTLDSELVDINGDGYLDLILGEGSAAAFGFDNLVYINDGTGNFTDESFRFPTGQNGNTSEIEHSDVDCDGDPDVAVSNLTIFTDVGPPGFPVYIAISGANELLLNDGNGFFSSSTLPQDPGAPFIQLEVAPGVFFTLEISSEIQFVDFDSDGDPDILIANENPFDPTSGGQNRAFENTGACSGTYVEVTATQMPALVDQSQGFRAADLDGDGDEDVVVIGVGPNYLLRNQLVETGSPGYVQEFTIGPAAANVNSTRNAALVDLDGDGNLDLVEANSRDEPNEVYFGDGTGSFTHAPGAIPAANITHTDVDVVDLDGDGVPDVYFTSTGGFLFNHGFLGEQDTYLVNDGNGFFEDRTFPNFPERVTTSTDSSFGDVDGDGDMDLFVSGSGIGPVGDPSGALDRLYINHGCDAELAFCLQAAADGLEGEIDGLDPAPGGDMTSSHQIVNEIRKAILAHRVDAIELSLHFGVLFGIPLQLKLIEWRVDGNPAPPDWVSGTSGERILAWVEFADCAIAWW